MKSRVKWLFLIVTLSVITMLAASLTWIISFHSENRKSDYDVIAINDTDKTLLGTQTESEKLQYLGYSPAKYQCRR